MRGFRRTRIFTVAVVLVGILLGLGGLAVTIVPEAAVPVSASGRNHQRNQPKHHQHQKQQHQKQQQKTQSQTQTQTLTQTVVVPPPSPSCYAYPNPVILQKTTGTIGNASFVAICNDMNPNATVTLNIANGICTNLTGTLNGFTPNPAAPAGNGVFTSQFTGTVCTTGTFPFSVTQNIGGLNVVTPGFVTIA